MHWPTGVIVQMGVMLVFGILLETYTALKAGPMRAKCNEDAIVMRVVVNGEERTLDEGVTLTGLLTGLGLNAGPIVVQRNGDIVERARMDQVTLGDGDQIELVRFVGGG